MRFRFLGGVLFAVSLAGAVPAAGEDIHQSHPITMAADANPGRSSSFDDFTVAVSPRLWFSNIIDKRFGSNDVEQTKSIFIPMSGATISVEPKGGRIGSIDFTALYGTSGGSPFTGVDLPSGGIFQGKVRVTRLDIETYVHIPIDRDVRSTTFNIGFRYVDSLNRVAGFDDSGVSFLNKERNTYFLSEFGVSATSQGLSSEHNDSFFGALNLEVGYLNSRQKNTCCLTPTEFSSTRSGGVVGLDGYFGYEYRFPTLSNLLPKRITLRYRLQIISAGGFDLSQPSFVHGPEAMLTWTF